jgi:hypothetical protein
MFDKRKHGFNTATQSFALAMTQVIMEEMIGNDVYITQSEFNGHELLKFARGQVNSHPLADSMLQVHVNGIFTCLEYPREITLPGVLFPPLPSFHAFFQFYNSNEYYFDWELDLACVCYSDFSGPKKSGGRTLRFVPPIILLNEADPSERIKKIANELQKRIPRRIREIE